MSEATMPAPPAPAVLMQIIASSWVTQLVGAFARYSLADKLADGPKTAEELAAGTNLHAPTLYRALRALAGVQVITQDADNRFGLTPVSELLRSDVPGSMRGLAILINHESHWNAWGKIDFSLETGLPAFDHIYGTDFFTHCLAHPDHLQVFNEAMTSLSGSNHAALVDAYDFSGIETLMDVGGCHGTLLGAILSRNPNMKGILFDLPHVVSGATPVLEKWGVTDRVQTCGGDFFEALGGPVDACILSTVIHDWDDERSLRILRNCHKAVRPGGKLLLSEIVIPEGGTPFPGKLSDINMLVMTPGGRERTEAEYRTLFAEAGFELTRIVPTASLMSVIEGVRRD